jgi:3-oxoacyl-[acyl-carrier protein] reductase
MDGAKTLGIDPRFDLTDKTIIVTGGGKGLGKVYVEELAKRGANVFAADIDGEANENVVHRLRAEGWRAHAQQTDIADVASVAALAKAALDKTGRIDVLINNASLMSVLPRQSWLEIPLDEWDRVMAVNLRGMFLCCRAVYPAMKERGYGKIINITSSRVFEGTPLRLHYTTSKAGVIGFTRALSREVGPMGITVNAIAPGTTLSDTQVGSSSPEFLAARVAGRAIPRNQLPEDLVGAVIFFSSPASDFTTGQTLLVDGGRAMH